MRGLRRRVANAGSNTAQVMAASHPVGTADTPMVMPLAMIDLVPSPGGYGSADPPPAGDYPGNGGGGVAGIRYQDVQTIWGPNGEPIPATGPGGWGQLRKAGRP